MSEIQLTTAILSQLTQMKWILFGILLVFVLILSGIIWILFYAKKANDKESKSGDFAEKASALLDKDDLDAVIELSRTKLESFPKDLYARWYIAQAYYRKNEYHKALKELNIISEIAPSWREDYIDPYIAEIKEKLDNHKPEVIKND
jgi:predicted negative regulator of RcsB-dependent stress response